MILIREGDRWAPAALTSYSAEEELQSLLASDPSLISGCAGAVAVRELAVPGVGKVDIVGIDAEGTITLVECKLHTNSQIRREIVGQIIAYASGLAGVSYRQFAGAFEARAKQSLVEAVSAAAGHDVDSVEFEEAVNDKLNRGHFRLVVAVDVIRDELRASVEYLNVHLQDTVSFMALELGYLKQDGVEILVPRTFGAELAATRKDPDGKSKARWTLEQVDSAVKQVQDRAQREVAERLLEHAKRNNAMVIGGTGAAPSAGFYYAVGEKRPSLWSLYVRQPGPVIALNLGSIANVDETLAERALERLRACDVLAARLQGESSTLIRKYPEFPVSELATSACAADAITAAFDDIVRNRREENRAASLGQ